MANTVIQLKYSTVTSTPTSLSVGEPAYSFQSDKLFIGNSTNHVLTIGGKYYVDIIDAATDAATPSTLVTRDANGNASFNYITANVIGDFDGVASSAEKLETARFFNFSGDATGSASFDGTANADITLELTNTGVDAKTYGSSTNIPIITVDEDGRLTAVSNAAISTSLGIAADSGTDTIALATDTLTFAGGDGIATDANAQTNTVTFDVDNTVIRTTGNQTITGDFTISGNLNVQGNTVTHDVDTLIINDPIILLANNNPDNVVDIGFVAHYEDGSANTKHTGLIRHVASNTWYLFENYEPHVQEDHILNITDPTLVTSNLVANLTGGKIFGLTEDLAVSDGGTGAGTFTQDEILVGNGTGPLKSLANTGTAGTYGSNDKTLVVTTDGYGRVSSVVANNIEIDASQVITGTLPIARGGTNQTTFTSGQIVHFDGTSLASLANSTYTLTGGLATSNTITSLTVDDYGRVTAATGESIALDASQITTGTLGVARGGTGAGTFTVNGVLLGNGTGAFNTASSSTEGHVLQINNSGVPTFAMLSGGTF
jgi:hypothetical protein